MSGVDLLDEEVFEGAFERDHGFEFAAFLEEQADGFVEAFVGEDERSAGSGDDDAIGESLKLFEIEGGKSGEGDLGFESAEFGEKVVKGAEFAELSFGEDGDAIAEHLDVLEDVGGKEDGFSAVTEAKDDIADIFSPDRIESTHGFIEDHEIGVIDQGLCDADALDHAFGVFAQGKFSGVREADLFDESLDTNATDRTGNPE